MRFHNMTVIAVYDSYPTRSPLKAQSEITGKVE